MMILTYPDKALSEKSSPVAEIIMTPRVIKELIDKMLEVMKKANGIGLAAPQIGMLKQIIVLESIRYDSSMSMINPEITLQTGESVDEEACLSVPGYSAKVKRSADIHVHYYDIFQDATVTQHFTDRDAIVIQHEIDHLNGILFIDHLSHLKRDMFERKYKKIMKIRGMKKY